jgi:hypothetical protein
MQLAALVVVGVVALAFVLGWVLRRLGSTWGIQLPFYAGILARLFAGLILAWSAVRAASRGGFWFAALGVGLGVIALGTLALTAFLMWGLIKYGGEVKE